MFGPSVTRGRAPVADDAGDRAVRAMVEADTASRLLGIEVVALEPGHVTMRMTVLPSMINGHSTCHGGYLFLLADSAFGCGLQQRGRRCDRGRILVRRDLHSTGQSGRHPGG